MFTRTLRKSFKRQEGQALVVACLMALVLTIAVLSVVNIGHMITERVRLQNTADASAYTTAAMEARAYNFYAFSNRTQVSHYVSAMLTQTMLSVVFFLNAFFTDLFGIALTIMQCSQGSNLVLKALCTIAKAIPIVGQILTAVDTIMKFLRTFLDIFNAVMDPLDKLVGKVFIPALNILNRVYAGASFAVMAGAYTHIVGASAKIVQENDPNVNSAASLLASGIVSACAFRMTHDAAAFPGIGGVGAGNNLTFPQPWKTLNPKANKDTGSVGDQRTARAKRIMGGISNATRYAGDDKSYAAWYHLQTKRGLGDLIVGFLPSELNMIKNFINKLADKHGQTRMLSYSYARGWNKHGQPINYIREKNSTPAAPSTGMMSQGDNIGSDDTYRINIGPKKFGVSFLSVDNPLYCKEDDDYRFCWGDPRFDQKDGNGIRKYGVKPSIWAINDDEKRNGTGATKLKGIHWRLVTTKIPNPGAKGGETGNKPISNKFGSFSNTMMQSACLSDIEKDCPKRGLNEEKFGLPFGLTFFKRAANVRYTEDGNHEWAGIVPFMNFEPGQYKDPCGIGAPSLDQAALYDHEFNQPSTWTMLNKSPDDLHNPAPDPKSQPFSSKLALLSDDGKVSFSMGSGGGTELEMDNTKVKGLGFLPEGLNVISRGQTYYHRPGNWAEQPNFFNPYWRPRLASVYQGLNSTMSRFPQVQALKQKIPGPLAGIPQKIITH